MITTELVVHPFTGEALELHDAETSDLAQLLDSLKDYESRLKEAKSLIGREVLRRQDLKAEWTTRAGGFILKGASPATESQEEFDGLALHSELLGLVDEGALSIEAVDAAVETEVVYTPKKAGIAKLRKLGGVVAQIVDRHATTTEKTRYVSISRADA
jgi:hypothetical protein